jgi:signal transduction histidine kinase
MRPPSRLHALRVLLARLAAPVADPRRRAISGVLLWLGLALLAAQLLVEPSLEKSPLNAGFEAAVMILPAALVVGATAARLTAARSHAEAQLLLRDLRSAHDELRRHAGEVKELTVAHERARMAREMHDSLGHHLTVITVGLENAERFRRERPEQAWQEVHDAKELTREALLDARRWVHAMRPLRMEQRLIAEALAALAESFGGTGVNVLFAVQGAAHRLDDDVELVLYRVLQEGLTNTLRHSGARQVRVSVTFGDDSVTLAIADDGGGSPAAPSERGFGLASLAERARTVGGTLTEEKGDAGGFTLRVELPTTRP